MRSPGTWGVIMNRIGYRAHALAESEPQSGWNRMLRAERVRRIRKRRIDMAGSVGLASG
jgi:hypothetical protein